MGFYQDRILPHLIHHAMRHEDFSAYRSRLLPAARGRVLEIGIGSGLNLPLYSDQVEQVVGLDPCSRLLSRARAAARTRASPPIELIEG
ncbi:MAG TPA: methyltransferase domain-containing protein, partial [Thermoanaerobaculia bacterium]|nr:methyltransferase domain-containing protein [Thermoanaerobaculia bacterium]